MTNFRPISKLFFMSKILEKTVTNVKFLIISFLPTDSGEAFDTVNHDILFACLEQWVGIRCSVQEWFRSYLLDIFCQS